MLRVFKPTAGPRWPATATIKHAFQFLHDRKFSEIQNGSQQMSWGPGAQVPPTLKSVPCPCFCTADRCCVHIRNMQVKKFPITHWCSCCRHFQTWCGKGFGTMYVRVPNICPQIVKMQHIWNKKFRTGPLGRTHRHVHLPSLVLVESSVHWCLRERWSNSRRYQWSRTIESWAGNCCWNDNGEGAVSQPACVLNPSNETFKWQRSGTLQISPGTPALFCVYNVQVLALTISAIKHSEKALQHLRTERGDPLGWWGVTFNAGGTTGFSSRLKLQRIISTCWSTSTSSRWQYPVKRFGGTNSSTIVKTILISLNTKRFRVKTQMSGKHMLSRTRADLENWCKAENLAFPLSDDKRSTLREICATSDAKLWIVRSLRAGSSPGNGQNFRTLLGVQTQERTESSTTLIFPCAKEENWTWTKLPLADKRRRTRTRTRLSRFGWTRDHNSFCTISSSARPYPFQQIPSHSCQVNCKSQ